MSNKKRGFDAERELLHLLSLKGFAVARIAGSGMMKETSCDLLAGNGKEKYAIEVKISSKEKKYIEKKQIENLREFSKKFGAIPLIAIKFLRKGWFFLRPEQLKKTKKGFVALLEEGKKETII
ncbi:MAG: Holliday junction resolvase Hjc [Candidatus Pacearchaeota archaeon]|nr:Holliday junction resolvase Hjc [Candidatus Pacearchaeota archaeon]